MFDKELMKQVATIPTSEKKRWFAERPLLEECASRMTRLNVNEMIREFGVARVMRVLAATIKRNPKEYDADIVEMANWIPPVRSGQDAEMWFTSNIHRKYVQDIFRKYAELRKA